MNGRAPFLLRSYTNFLNITLKSKSEFKKQKDKSISYKVIQKTLSYFLKVSEILTSADTESFLGGGGGGDQNGPPSARQLNVI